jgi:hypothetical protein
MCLRVKICIHYDQKQMLPLVEGFMVDYHTQEKNPPSTCLTVVVDCYMLSNVSSFSILFHRKLNTPPIHSMLCMCPTFHQLFHRESLWSKTNAAFSWGFYGRLPHSGKKTTLDLPGDIYFFQNTERTHHCIIMHIFKKQKQKQSIIKLYIQSMNLT